MTPRAETVHFDLETTKVGDLVKLVQVITEEQVNQFARVSGDDNPLHMSTGFARLAGFRDRVVHGMVTGSLVSQLIGTKLPGPGALWTEQSFRWLAPVFIGDTIEVVVKVMAKSPGAGTVSLEARATNQNGKTVLEGNGVVRVLEKRAAVREIPLMERSALIVGEPHGAAAAIAAGLAATGAKVTLLYSAETPAGPSLCDELFAAGGQGIAVRDSGDHAASVQSALQQAQRAFERPVDILVNCTNLSFEPRPFLETQPGVFEHQITRHLLATVTLCQAVLPAMLEAGSGRIVHLGFGVPASTPYWSPLVAANAALKALTQNLAAEFGPKGVRVNLVSAGLMEGDAEAGVPPRALKLQAMQAPLRRLATPEDVSRIVVFLCSEQAEYITGADIPVCGGSVR